MNEAKKKKVMPWMMQPVPVIGADNKARRKAKRESQVSALVNSLLETGEDFASKSPEELRASYDRGQAPENSEVAKRDAVIASIDKELSSQSPRQDKCLAIRLILNHWYRTR